MATHTLPPAEDRRSIRTFRDLKVWEKAFALALDVHRLAADLDGAAPEGLARGMQESALGTTTHIAQGHTHSYIRDFLRCLDQSLAALSDLETRVLLAQGLGLFPGSVGQQLEERIAEVRRMEWGLVNRLRAREGQGNGHGNGHGGASG